MGKGSVKLSIYSTFKDDGTKKAQRAIDAFTKKYGEVEKKSGKLQISGATRQLLDQSVAADQAAAKLDKYATAVGKAASAIAPLSAASAGVIGGSIKLATDYEKGLAKVSTITDKNVMSMGEMGNQLLSLSNDTGRSVGELEEAAYQAQSASVSTQDTVGFVGEAVKLSKAGFTDTTTAVDTLTTVINAYGYAASDAGTISDKLVQTQNKGKTTVDELSKSIGNVIPTASAYHVSLDNLLTSYVTLTKQGIDTANSTTYINSMLTELADDGSDVSKILKDETGKSFTELMDSGMSLGDVMQILSDHVGGNTTEFANLWGNVRAGKGALALVNGGAEEFDQQLADMAGSAGTVGKALEDLKTPAGTAEKAVNKLKNTGVQLGEVFLAAAAPAIDRFSDAAGDLYNWFSGLDQSGKQTVATVLAITAAAAPALKAVQKGISLASSGHRTYAKLTATLAELSTRGGFVGSAAVKAGKGLDVATKAARGLGIAAAGLVADQAVIELMGIGEAGRKASDALNAATGGFTTFSDKISQASTATVDMSSAVSSSGQTFEQLQGTIDSSESAISAILQQRFSEQQGLRDSDIEHINGYTEKIVAAEQTKLDTYRSTIDGFGAAAQAEGSITEDQAAKYLSSAQSTYDQALADLDTYYQSRIALINQKYPDEESRHSEAYQTEINQAADAYNQMKSDLDSHLEGTKSAVTGAMQTITTDQLTGWNDMLANRDKFTNSFDLSTPFGIQTSYVQQTVAEYKNALSGMDLATTSSFLQQSLTVAQNTGKISGDVKGMADNILQNMYGMPGPMQDAATQTMRALASGLDDQLGIDVANSTADQIIDAYRSKIGEAEVTGTETGNAYTDGVGSADGYGAGASVAGAAQSGLSSGDGYTPGASTGGAYTSGVQSADGYGAGASVAGAATSGLGTGNGYSPGAGMGSAFTSGVRSADGYGSGSGLASSANSGLNSVDTTSTGSWFGEGFVNGIAEWFGPAADKAAQLAHAAADALNRAAQIGSPSKLTRQTGRWFGEGFEIGIDERRADAYPAARRTALAAAAGIASEDPPRAAVPYYGIAGRPQAQQTQAESLVVAWLDANLPRIISEYTPVMTDRDFGRAVRKHV